MSVTATESTASTSGIGRIGTTSTTDIGALMARNSGRFGVDVNSLAADMADMPVASRDATVTAIASSLSPLQQGQLARALAEQTPAAPNPLDDFGDTLGDLAGGARDTLGDVVDTATDYGEAAWNGAKTAAGWVGDRVGDVAGGIADGAEALAEKAGDGIESASDILGSLFGSDETSASGIATDPALIAVIGTEGAALAARSPSLSADLQAITDAGWTIEIGTAGNGSYADRTSQTITLDPNGLSDPGAAVQVLAHEVGHARHTPTNDTSSREAFLRSALGDEGAATLSNVRAQREILAAGGPDIGIAGNSANHAAYNAAYDQLLIDGDAEAARDRIGAIFGEGETTSTTGETYNEYYGGFYDDNYGGG